MKTFDGKCTNSGCEDSGQVKEFSAERVEDDLLVGAQCTQCHGRVMRVFAAVAIGGAAQKSCPLGARTVTQRELNATHAIIQHLVSRGILHS